MASATTHLAECFTTSFSAIAHHQFGNIDRILFRRLFIPGIIGSIAGVYLLTRIDSTYIKPLIAFYLLLLGLIIIIKAFRTFPSSKRVINHLVPLGLFGGLMDAVGGGGWGPIVTSTLLAQGNNPRLTIGSVNACEFFITLTASAAFFFNDIHVGWKVVLALACGGAIAAPLGAWLCRSVPIKWMMLGVGFLIICLSSHLLWEALTKT